jgi:hypothetical protein
MVAEDVALTIPSSIVRTLNALGGILVLYLVFGIINNIIAWKRNRKLNKVVDAIQEMGRDVESIRKLLVKKL